MTFERTEDYRLGIPILDDDHRRMAVLVDGFLEGALANRDRSELTRSLDLLLAEARAHFAREEELMDRSNYPHLARHRAEHEQLAAQLLRLRERFAAGEIVVVDGDAAAFLRAWLFRHIREADRAFVPYAMRLA